MNAAACHHLSEVIERDVRLERAEPGRQRGFDWPASIEFAALMGLLSWVGAPPYGVDTRVVGVDGDEATIESVFPAAAFWDAGPVHAISTASLRRLAQLEPTGDWDVRRFRPNVVIDSDLDGFPEMEWEGQQVRIGESQFDGGAPTIRCAMTTRSQPALDANRAVLRAIHRHLDLFLGSYLYADQNQTIRVGDLVVVGA